MIFLVTVYAFNPDLNSEEPICVTTGRHFNYQGNTYYPYLDKSIVISEELFNNTTVEGEASQAIGEVSFNNVDGRYDYLESYLFDGRRVEIHAAESEDTPEDEVVLIFTGTSRYYALTVQRFTVYIKTKLEELNTAMLSATFAGTNSGRGGSGGYEGTEEALKGAKKPSVYGRVFNIQPANVNEFFLIYACNYDKDGNRKAIESFWSVRARGMEMVYEGDVADAATLQAATVSAGFYKTCVAEGLFRLGTVPNGEVTCDVIEQSGDEGTTAGVVKRVLEDFCGYVADTDFDTISLNKLDEANSCPVGVYVTDAETKAEVVVKLLQSIGAWISPTPFGVFRFGIIDIPSSLSVLEVTGDNYIRDSLEKVQTGDQGRNIPSYMVTLKHTKNWKVQTKDSFVHAVPSYRQELLTRPFTEEVMQDLTIKEKSPNSPALVYETLLQGPVSVYVRNANLELSTSASTDVERADWYKDDTGAGGVLTNDVANREIDLTAGTNYIYAAQDFARPGRIQTGKYTLKFKVNSSAGTLRVYIQENNVETSSATVVAVGGVITHTFLLTSTGVVSVGIGTSSQLSFTDVSLKEYQEETPTYELERRFNIQKGLVKQYVFKLDYSLGLGVQAGDTITLTDERFSLSSGTDFMVISKETDTSNEEITFGIWRP